METYPLRREDDYLPEQNYLTGRVLEIEKALGKVAAGLGEPTPITQPLDALDRARELAGDLAKEVRVRSLADAVRHRLDWLARAEARAGQAGGEPKTDLNRIALDRRLLQELEAGWKSRRN